MANGSEPSGTTAARLTMAIRRLRSRLREESRESSVGLSISQLALLHRLDVDGPTTAASLAAAEHVSQQAVAQLLSGLKADGLVRTKPDPADGRKTLISATAAGRRVVESTLASRDAWLVRAIEATISPAERPQLDRAIELLERLADADLRSQLAPS